MSLIAHRFDNSGRRLSYPQWQSSQSNIDRTNAIIKRIASMFASDPSVVSVIAPLNECVFGFHFKSCPLTDVSATSIDRRVIIQKSSTSRVNSGTILTATFASPSVLPSSLTHSFSFTTPSSLCLPGTALCPLPTSRGWQWIRIYIKSFLTTRSRNRRTPI